MKRKIGIIAVGIILLFISQAFNPAAAMKTKRDENKNMLVDISYMMKDGTLLLDTIQLTKNEYEKMKNGFINIFENMNSQLKLETVKELITKLDLFNNRPVLRRFIIQLFSNMQRDRRPLALSYGSCNYFLPMDKNKIKMRNRLCFWNYNGISGMQPKTYILQSNYDEFDIYEGRQMGFMTGFLGLYMKLRDRESNMCRTFFMGSPRHIRGMVY